MFTARHRTTAASLLAFGFCLGGTWIGCSNHGVDAVVSGSGGASNSGDHGSATLGGKGGVPLVLGGAATSSSRRSALGGTSSSAISESATDAAGGVLGSSSRRDTARHVGGAPNTGTLGTGGASPVPEELASSCPGICNAVVPSNPRFTDPLAIGNVTMYTTEASHGGACNYGKTGVLYFAAINVSESAGDGKGQWQEGRFCGQCVEVTVITTQGPKQVVVRIMDRCADVHCGVDLGGEAPAAIMADGFGRYDGAWRLVPCSGHPEVFDGAPSLFVKEGSNAYWSAVQVRNPDTAVSAIRWQNEADTSDAGTFQYGSPSLENYYFVPQEVLQGKGTYQVTVQYSDGTSADAVMTSEQLAQPLALYPLK